MAQRVQVILEDDIDGGEAAETITFGLDGVEYEIDLSEKNAGKLRDELASWVGHARRAGGRKKSSTGGSTGRKHSPEELQQIRDWARAHGAEVSDRGRVPTFILDAYASNDPQMLSKGE